MPTRRVAIPALIFFSWMIVEPAAHAQWAVVDVGAIAQLVQQVQVMREHLTTAQDQLAQARRDYAAITGTRRMQSLMRDVERNYLPRNWNELAAAALREAQGAHGVLAAEVRHAIDDNASLTPAQFALLLPAERADLETTRRTTAMLQVLARRALSTTSERFVALEQLIDAIATATDQKAILDLQARIGAEATMLANEQTKLEVIQRAAEAESFAHQQRLLERAIQDIGSLRNLPPLGL